MTVHGWETGSRALGVARLSLCGVGVAASLLLAACGLPRWLRSPAVTDESSEPLARADRLVTEGNAREAAELYASVARHRGTPQAERALRSLGRIQVDPKGLRDYRGARKTYDRLVGEYPDSPFAPEARSWQAVLQELDRRDAETTRLRGDLDRLKALDIDMERRR